MSALLRARAVPIFGTAALGSAIWYSTSGGRNQPRSRAEAPRASIPVSETLEGIAGSGGKRARKETLGEDPKDTRVMSRRGSAPSKRSAGKVRGEEE